MFLEITKDIETFFNSHLQVNAYGFGPSTDIGTSNKQFPMVWTEPVTAPIGEFEIKYKFNIYAFTLYEQDKSNLLHSINDTQRILLDFIAHFRYNANEKYEINLANLSIDPFTAKFDDYTNGWILNVEFSTSFDYNSCDLPIA